MEREKCSVALALATTAHDPDGRYVAGVERVHGRLAELFDIVVVNASQTTSPCFMEAVKARIAAHVITHAPGLATVGLARRDAVLVARRLGARVVLYADLDHVLRWAEAKPDEIASSLALAEDHDLVVIGRSRAAFDAMPERLRATESLVNHVYKLATGRAWDLMFAVRVLSGRAVDAVVAQCEEPTLANDVVWPLLAERKGLGLAYFAAEGLSYRVQADFDRPNDDRDSEPLLWAQRLELAGLHAQAMKPYLAALPPALAPDPS